MVAQQRNPFGIQFVDAPRPFAPVPHQPRILQHPQMLRNRWARYGQARRQLVHRLRVISQHLEDGQPGGVTQRCQSVLNVSIHLP